MFDILMSVAFAYITVHAIRAWENWYYPRAGVHSFYRSKRRQAKEEARRKELQAEQKHLYYHNHMTDFYISEWVKRGIDESWQGFFQARRA